MFKDVLNEYLENLNCSSKELSTISGISQTVISRYRKGLRTPLKDSEQITKIANAIFELSNKEKKFDYTLDKILESLNSSINSSNNYDYENFSKNLNILINTLNINTNEMAKYIAFDASHISRIKNGKSKPSNLDDFSKKICNFVYSRYKDSENINNLSIILNCNIKNLSSEKFCNILFSWLTSENANSQDQINTFLTNLDNFNLDTYIKAIKFDKLKVPNVLFYKERTKHYYGIEEMKKGELNFFKATVLSKSSENIFMCSDMPMEDMAKDIEFGKKWMFAIAMCLKKGLHLNIIHNLDRPFNEMMLGLESWIPIYMTGQVSPYYLKEVKNSVYHHFDYVSGSVALSGECIKGSHDKGMYYLTTNKNEIKYYREKTNLLLKKANSLMDIYRKENSNEFKIFLQNDKNIKSDRKRFLSSLPLFTITDSLLIEILKRNKISEDDVKKIICYKNEEKNHIESILLNNRIFDNIYTFNEKEFNENKPILTLNNMFYTKEIYYSYKEYKKHLELTQKYAKNNLNYEINKLKNRTFKNITISILLNNYVIISKNTNPTIHFVIRHKKLTDAIKNFNPLIKE